MQSIAAWIKSSSHSSYIGHPNYNKNSPGSMGLRDGTAAGSNTGGNSLFPAANSAQRAGASQGRLKVVLAPGHSPLDWAELNLKENAMKLRGLGPGVPPPQYVRVTPQQLREHAKKDDCWTCIDGKVYNITAYVDFHPGGVTEILKCAGKDGTALFNKYHRWVNAERMLHNCWIGVIQR